MYNKYDDAIWKIHLYMMDHYGCDTAQREMTPLYWYINTGRASTAFLNLLVSAKPYMIARRLHKGGSIEDVIDRICSYLKYNRAA